MVSENQSYGLEVDRRGRILLVDDLQVNIVILSQLFKGQHEVAFALNGEKAVELCRSFKPDLILLDIEMPYMSGFEVCEQLKADNLTKDSAIIFVSAHHDEEIEAKGFEMGAVDFIHKPINATITKARVENQLLLKKQTDTLRSLVMLDSLTGIGNRHHVERRLPEAWRNSIRLHSPISILMLDVDYFKRYNDIYGHQEGDKALTRIAQVIANTIRRPYDFCARYGGEEFICVLPDTDMNGAQVLAQQIVDAVRELHIPHSDSDVSEYVTICAGVSSIIPDQTSDWEREIESADKQLYLAKEHGRDRIEPAI
ncbi:GGDEF domain-containing response regulator [Shewanella psychrotolerans]|uniref:GGDEF domain-containing response regulator n=1 Tax=Shewanella psychrotolerans TaxID=2864206 RepID=UPI001C65EB5D|nr:diguanylate cyclase [Shewanella psychrotolerans]QYK00708.1 diguanylate cyclase [Shewanella psychrotolerans]